MILDPLNDTFICEIRQTAIVLLYASSSNERRIYRFGVSLSNMGFISSTVRFLLVLAIIGLCLLWVPSVDADERTYSYTIPNSTPITMGHVNDSFDFRAGDEVSISWESDMDLLSFNILCTEFSDQYHAGYLIKWSGNFSIDVDCTVFVEWVNDKDVPAHVELTIVRVSASLFDNPSILWTMRVMLAVAIAVVVAIALSRRRRAGEPDIGSHKAIEVMAMPDHEGRPSPGPGTSNGSGGRCGRCGAINPPDAEFCQECNRPIVTFRRRNG